MSSAATPFVSEHAGTQGIGKVFCQYREELEWLANLLTGDESVAVACVVDARALAESQTLGLEDWLLKWARLATIRSVVQVQRSRIAQLSLAYMRRPCTHGGHTALSQDSLELVIEESGFLISQLDLLCRCAIVICGMERRTTQEAALLLGIDAASVEGAYCAALQFLEVIGCEQFRQRDDFPAVCN